MKSLKKFYEGGYAKYILPGGLLQSVLIGGGYATGREIYSYGAKFGAMGWISGLTIGIGFALFAFLTFEICRIYKVYDYKNYSDEFGIIQNDNILAWMTPETDGILQVRRNAVSWLEQSFGTEYGMLPGYQPAYGFTSDQGAYITYYQVAAMQSAISSMGVRYNMGPYSFSASQRVLMPDAVLENGSGICIETAVLMASVLESASMHAMIVFTPGHAQTAVETWSGSGQYFLIETTMLPFTATQDALQSLIQPLSAEEWANYLYNKEQEAQQSGGMVYVVDCDLAPVLNIQGLNY